MTNRYKRVLEAFAVGDAMGMVTEFMTYRQIHDSFGFVEDLLDPVHSLIHPTLERGQITDDTEQVLYLIGAYATNGDFSQETVKRALVHWFDDCDPIGKGYIGPSSQKAIERFKRGEESETGGTTSGAPMRVLAPVLCNLHAKKPALIQAIMDCVTPTHDTNLAIESSLALGFAYKAVFQEATAEEMIDAAIDGAKIGADLSRNEFVGPSIAQRLKIMKGLSSKTSAQERSKISDQERLEWIYGVLGTTMEAVDVTGAAIAISAYCREDVWLAICMGASIGGDTDTIAAIAGALCAFQAIENNIPQSIIERVTKVNRLNLAHEASLIERIEQDLHD